MPRAMILAALLSAAPAAAQTPTTIPGMWNAWCARCHGRTDPGRSPSRRLPSSRWTSPTARSPRPSRMPTGRSRSPGWTGGRAVVADAGVRRRADARAGRGVRQPDSRLLLASAAGRSETSICRGRSSPRRRSLKTKSSFCRSRHTTNTGRMRTRSARFTSGASVQRAQIEAVLPVERVFVSSLNNPETGVGDVEVGLKYALTPAAAAISVERRLRRRVSRPGRGSRWLGGFVGGVRALCSRWRRSSRGNYLQASSRSSCRRANCVAGRGKRSTTCMLGATRASFRTPGRLASS